ncbi:hypothetical protein K2P47_02430 [Patescibacteria group bacterium]|nr:hypothetical protein [Patescibacteria group bacterium]
MHRTSMYVGMALTDAPPEFRIDFQNELKSELRKLPDVTVLDFVGLEDGTAVEVYNHDRKCTEGADLCIFIVDHASTGLGMEIMIRHHSRRHMLFFAKKNSRVTRMLTGFLQCEGRNLGRYEDVADIIAAVKEFLDQRNHSA